MIGLLLCRPSSAKEIQSLEELRRAILDFSPQVVASKEAWRISTRIKNSSFGALLPRLDLTSSLLADHQGEPEPIDQSGSSLRLSANFYNSHLDWYAYRIAEHQERVAELQYYTEVGAQIIEGINLYLNYSDQSVILNIAEQRKRLVDEQFANSRRSYRSGTSTRLDFLRLQSEKKSSEFEVIRARSEYAQAKNRLVALFGSMNEELVFRPLVFNKGKDLPIISMNLQVESHPEYQIQKQVVRAAEYEVKQSQRRYWPQISLDTEWINGSSGYWVDGASHAWGTEFRTILSFTFNLFDGGQLSNEVANQRSQLVINQSNAELTRLRLISDIENLKIEANILKGQVQSTLEILEIETQVFNSISREYRVGNLSYLDFINSLNRRLSAQLNVQTSISNYLKTYYRALYHQGVLLND